LLALENSSNVNADQTVVFRFLGSVAHQAPSRSELAKKVDRGHSMADRQCGQLLAADKEQLIGHDHEPTGSQFDQGCEGDLDLAFAACMEDMELQPEGARRCLQGSRKRLSNTGIGRVDEQGHARRAGHYLMQQLEPLRPYLYIQASYARQVA